MANIIIKSVSGILLVIVLFNLFRVSRTLKYTIRLSKFVIANKDIPTSIGDELILGFNRIKGGFLKILLKSSYFNRKVKHYSRFVHNNNHDKKDALNIIAIKFIIAFALGILYVISGIITGIFEVPIMLLLMVIGFFAYDVYLNILENRRNKTIEDDLLKAIIIMNNAFKSGYNITQAIDIVAKDLTGPISEEFKKISDDLKYGLDLKDVFDRFYERARIDDAKYITSSLSLLNLTGGNLVGIFSSIEKSFTNKKRLKEELNAMTGSSTLVYRFLLIMPFCLIGFICLLNPTFFVPLFTSAIGILAIIIALILYVAYIIIIKRILRIDVL